ncbi:hypothetical protein M422DRAFT_54300 [Sphaerobolus stellatus SS14]|uniref:Uncharacterized protein n=1 Tax=Sphaerobolus stellatus (strain SS14) TaxID=990650 RepID=A0A0C9UVF7_SPHS4|nr:hypothetical protein M422DRAFT_54300 [Sphaerobolus stellatus SS14]
MGQCTHCWIIDGGVIATLAALFPNPITEKVVFLAVTELMQMSYNMVGLPAEAPPAPADADPELAADSSNVTKVVHPHYIHQITFYEYPSLSSQMLKLPRESLPGFTRAFAFSFRDGPIRGFENASKMIADTPRLKCCIIHGTGDRTVP